jgi:hypothetical protein
MGIKFRCPNGHKLNVKTFLAGKRGVCPDCGATFRIPEEPGGSDIQAAPLVSAKGSNGAAPSPPQPVPETVALGTTRPAPSPAPAPVAPSPVAQAAVVPAVVAVAPVPTAMPVSSGIPLPTSPAMMPATVAAPGVVPATYPGAIPAGSVPAGSIPRPPVPPGMPSAGDPIADAPAAIWYVRPPSGGQYGPARGDIMRKWIAEGRVSGDSLVWREGWADWRNAAQLFPSLAAAASSPTAVMATPSSVPQSARSTSRYAARKKGGSGLAIAALVGLVLVCIVLVVVLVVVLTQQAA